MTNFLLGFLSSSVLFLALVIAYYLRAKRRVRSIQAAIEQYQKANAAVGGACDKTYGCNCRRTDPAN